MQIIFQKYFLQRFSVEENVELRDVSVNSAVHYSAECMQSVECNIIYRASSLYCGTRNCGTQQHSALHYYNLIQFHWKLINDKLINERIGLAAKDIPSFRKKLEIIRRVSFFLIKIIAGKSIQHKLMTEQ